MNLPPPAAGPTPPGFPTHGGAPVTDSQRLLAAGLLRPLEDGCIHPTLGHSPITYVSTRLWDELAALAIAPDAAALTVRALLRDLAARAVDAALSPGNEGAPRDDLYVTFPAHIGPRRHTVWFQRSGPRGLITATFPPER
ncbi:hypothetical protein ACWEQL_15620 [Kitasatospora sp. NPDC004240]